MRKRAAKGILLLLITACVGLALFSGRPAVAPQELLLEDPRFPSRWEDEKGPVHVTWQSIASIGPTDPYPDYPADANAFRAWSDHGERLTNISVVQGIYSYRTPIQAILSYHIVMPEFWPDSRLPNFWSDHGASRRYPADWSYKSPFADQEHVVCGMGIQEACQFWLYWSRYGPYFMKVSFFGPNQGIGPDLFQQIVSEIDTYVGKKLTP